jgi:hypothetical protein
MVSIGKWLIYGLIGAFAISALVDPQRAFATTQAFRGVGGALGSLGGGVQSLLTGVGTGTAKLFNPLFTLRDLIYPTQAGAQTPKDIRELASVGAIQSTPQYIADIQTIESQPGTPSTTTSTLPIPSTPSTPTLAPFIFQTRPSISPVPVAKATVHAQNLPMSQAAIEYYNRIGVEVSPSSSQTVQSSNTSNATSAANVSSGSYVNAVGVASWLL